MRNPWWWVAVVISAALWAAVSPPAVGSVGIAAGWAPKAPYVSPIAPMRVEALARLPAEPWLAGHRGLDLQATVGQAVRAAASGEVSFVGMVVDRPVLTIRHSDGALSSVEPVNSELEVGARVHAGDTIGTVSDVAGHCAPRTCVHWGVRVAGDYIDPLDVLAGYGPVVLLPRSAGSRRSIRRTRPYGAATRGASSRRPSGFGTHATP